MKCEHKAQNIIFETKNEPSLQTESASPGLCSTYNYEQYISDISRLAPFFDILF